MRRLAAHAELPAEEARGQAQHRGGGELERAVKKQRRHQADSSAKITTKEKLWKEEAIPRTCGNISCISTVMAGLAREAPNP